MMNEIVTLYQTRLLEPPHLPPRSRLYHLHPLGLGTTLTESLTSYVVRLAAAHRVTVRKLFIHEIAPQFDPHYPQTNISSLMSTFSYLLNGFDSQAQRWCLALERLTQQPDLRFLTLLTWQQVLASQKLLRPYLAWCPACYQSWRQAEQQLYEPLLWTLQAVVYCPFHQQLLQEHCPYADCHKRLYPLTPHRQIGFCPYCERWLGTLPVQPLPDDDQRQPWSQWSAQAVGDMLAAAPLVTSPPRQQIAAAVGFCVDHLAAGRARSLTNLLGMTEGRLMGWLRGKSLPQLGSLLELCHRLDLSPYHFLTEVPNAAGNVSLTRQHMQAIQERLTRNTTHRHQVQRLRTTLQAILDSDETPPLTLNTVARQMGHTPQYLHNTCPDLAQALLERTQNYEIERKAGVQQALKAALAEMPVPSVADMGLRLGLHDHYLYGTFPELCQLLSQQHTADDWARQVEAIPVASDEQDTTRQARIEKVKMALTAIVAQDQQPPLTLVTIADTLGCSQKFLQSHCAEQCQIIRERRQALFRVKRQRLRQQMQAILNRHDNPPPTMLVVAQELGCSTQLVTYYLPDLVTELMRRRQTARTAELEALQQALKTALDSDETPPPSLAQVAHTLDLSPHRLRKHFPQLCHAISNRFQRYRQQDKLARWAAVREAVQAVVDELAGGTPPSIKMVAKQLDFSPDLLRKVCPDLCQQIMARRQAYLEDRKGMWQAALQAVLDGDEQPAPSLPAVADRLGLHRVQLRTLFPDLAQAISARYQADQQQQAQELRHRRCEEVRQVTRDLHCQGIYPSLTQVAARLSLPNFMVRQEACAARLEVLRELGLRD